MSLAIANVVAIRSPFAGRMLRGDLGRLVGAGVGTFGMVMAGGLLVAAMTTGAAACTGTTLMASAVQLPVVSHSA